MCLLHSGRALTPLLLQVVIHFTDGADGDLADLQRASEALRQEGGFSGAF